MGLIKCGRHGERLNNRKVFLWPSFSPQSANFTVAINTFGTTVRSFSSLWKKIPSWTVRWQHRSKHFLNNKRDVSKRILVCSIQFTFLGKISPGEHFELCLPRILSLSWSLTWPQLKRFLLIFCAVKRGVLLSPPLPLNKFSATLH